MSALLAGLSRLAVIFLVSLLIIGFLGIVFLIPLPLFLVLENIVVALLLAIGLLLTIKDLRIGLYLLSIVSLVYSGRISRSVISPTGSLLPLWEAHLAVVILLIALGILSMVVLARSSGNKL
ncbi:MAG: hypothetical protein RQ885_06815 [Desulfurococcales archaeon]|nr:hypothetical protein [Desulfurococcales archaeon]